MGFAAGLEKRERTQSTDEAYADYFESSFEDYLAMCKRLFQDCDGSEREAIQLIVQEIVKQSEEMRAQVASGAMESSPYLKPLEKNNRWGKAILALVEAFKVKLEQTVV